MGIRDVWGGVWCGRDEMKAPHMGILTNTSSQLNTVFLTCWHIVVSTNQQTLHKELEHIRNQYEHSTQT